jgi:DNA-binding GntR family transcriptional regulator
VRGLATTAFAHCQPWLRRRELRHEKQCGGKPDSWSVRLVICGIRVANKDAQEQLKARGGDVPMIPDEEPPEGLQDFVLRRLVQAIVSGSLAPGERVSPTKLAGDLGVSHIPVREALASMEASGYVVRVPRVGFFVADLSPDYIEDVYHWRQVLEDEACRIAVPRLDESDLALMRKINESAHRAVESQDGSYLGLNREFHFVAFERAGSEVLLRFLNHLWDAAARYQSTITYVSEASSLFCAEHNALIEAFEARDVNLVNARMAEHRYGTLRTIRELASADRMKASSESRDTVPAEQSEMEAPRERRRGKRRTA